MRNVDITYEEFQNSKRHHLGYITIGDDKMWKVWKNANTTGSREARRIKYNANGI